MEKHQNGACISHSKSILQYCQLLVCMPKVPFISKSANSKLEGEREREREREKERERDRYGEKE